MNNKYNIIRMQAISIMFHLIEKNSGKKSLGKVRRRKDYDQYNIGIIKFARMILCMATICFSTLPLKAQEHISKSFFTIPPSSAKPNVYWYFLDDQITKEGITKDLEQMKKVGIGGALMFNICKCNHDYNNNDGGSINFVQPGVKYLSPAWYQMVKHAADESNRLGLEFGIHNCPGWSSSGGPWITPELAMQAVTTSTTLVTGSTHFSAILAKPPTGLGYFKLNNYWDIAVLAFPTPQNYLINNWRAKAGYTRDANIKEDTTVLNPEMIIPLKSVIDLTSKMSSSGLLTWEVPPGQWTIMRIGYTPTGTTNSVPATGGQGLECDKLNHTAVQANWNGLVQNIINTTGAGAVKVVHIDSYEVGCQNWTPNFRQQFRNRRGYDMTPYLPVMSGHVVGSLEISERFLWDVRRTIGDLINDEYYGFMATLAHQNGMLLSAEPYGSGGFRNVSAGGKLDIPMGEFWTRTGRFTQLNSRVRDAASSAHLYGKRIVASEAFTSDFTDSGSAWKAHPYSLKQLGDLAFCTGVNRFTLHVYCHQPLINPSRPGPGYSVRGYGVQFGWTNTWWNQSAAWLRYIGRCQYMLQKGLSVTDVLRFCGEDTPSQGSYVEGVSYDVCDADAIINRMSVKNGRIVLPDGMSYKVLILERSESMTYELLHKISELVADGAIIIGKKPTRSPGLQDYPACDLTVQTLAKKMWGNIDGNIIKSHAYGAGKIYYNETIENVLAKLTLPDFQITGGDQITNIKYTHRRTNDAEIYFLSNQHERFETINAVFRVTGKTPELWYPETGKTVKCPLYKENAGQTTLTLMLDPFESVFVVFRAADASRRISSITRNDQPITQFMAGSFSLNKHPVAEVSIGTGGALKLIAWDPGLYKLDSIHVNISSLPPAIILNGPWQVSFPPKLGAPASSVFKTLASWTVNTDNGIKYFSGTATYKKEMIIPQEMIGSNKAVYLDLGDVKNIAEVEVNGISFGTLWKPPFRVDITSALKTGVNTLQIKVTNNWPNRLIGDKVLGQAITWKTWNLFYTSASPLFVSGLLGPVQLIPARLWYEFGGDKK